MLRTLGHPQGWFTDPYQLHKARWFSDGRPTALVRDDGVESTDPPPDTPYSVPLEPVVEAEGELLHSHVPGDPDEPDPRVDAIWTIFVATGGD